MGKPAASITTTQTTNVQPLVLQRSQEISTTCPVSSLSPDLKVSESSSSVFHGYPIRPLPHQKDTQAYTTSRSHTFFRVLLLLFLFFGSVPTPQGDPAPTESQTGHRPTDFTCEYKNSARQHHTTVT